MGRDRAIMVDPVPTEKAVLGAGVPDGRAPPALTRLSPGDGQM